MLPGLCIHPYLSLPQRLAHDTSIEVSPTALVSFSLLELSLNVLSRLNLHQFHFEFLPDAL